MWNFKCRAETLLALLCQFELFLILVRYSIVYVLPRWTLRQQISHPIRVNYNHSLSFTVINLVKRGEVAILLKDGVKNFSDKQDTEPEQGRCAERTTWDWIDDWLIDCGKMISSAQVSEPLTDFMLMMPLFINKLHLMDVVVDYSVDPFLFLD